MKNNEHKLILASSSPRRLELLKQLGVVPDGVVSPDIDETPLRAEKPKNLALRLSQQKAQMVYKNHKDKYVLAADTVVSCGQLVLDKAENKDQAMSYLKKLSGRRHKVYGGISFITPQGQCFHKICETIVQFKLLSDADINHYIDGGEWKGKAGGYAIQGYAGAFVKYMAGSYSNVVGLSLYDTMKMLGRGQYLSNPQIQCEK